MIEKMPEQAPDARKEQPQDHFLEIIDRAIIEEQERTKGVIALQAEQIEQLRNEVCEAHWGLPNDLSDKERPPCK